MFYTEARQLALSARDHRSKPLSSADHPNNARNTRIEIVDDRTVGIRLHDTYVVKLFDDGSFELNTGGWFSKTTKERINHFMPGPRYPMLVQIGSHRPSKKSAARWWVYGRDWSTKIGPFFDGIRISADGTILNAKPETDITVSVAASEAFEKAITKYLDAYMAAAADQIYVDGYEQAPDGAMTCWDCAMVASGKPELEGRTTEGGNKLAHLERHVGNREIVPELAWAALRAKGISDIGIAHYLGSTDTYIVQTSKRGGRGQVDPVRRAIRDYLRARLGNGISGARPVALISRAS